MKHLLTIFLVSFISVHSSHCTLNAFDQEPKRITRQFSMDDAVIIRELGAIIVPKEGQLVVDLILGNNEKQSADIQKDDIILMANGTKVKTVKELREQYSSAAVGQEFKVGLKRGEHLMIARFTKKSEADLNKESGGNGRMVIKMEGKEGEQVLPALGLRVTTEGTNAVVAGTLPSMENNFKTFIPKENDLILSINSKKVATAEEFDAAYTALKEGDTVTIEFSRNGKISKESFHKPKAMQRMIITK